MNIRYLFASSTDLRMPLISSYPHYIPCVFPYIPMLSAIFNRPICMSSWTPPAPGNWNLVAMSAPLCSTKSAGKDLKWQKFHEIILMKYWSHIGVMI